MGAGRVKPPATAADGAADAAAVAPAAEGAEGEGAVAMEAEAGGEGDPTAQVSVGAFRRRRKGGGGEAWFAPFAMAIVLKRREELPPAGPWLDSCACSLVVPRPRRCDAL
jgi:hypothetical protein